MAVDLKAVERDMKKEVERFEEEMMRVRAGRVTAVIFENIKVNYWGTPTPLPHVASINIIDAKTVVLQPYDKSVMNDIVKAIRESDLNVNPMVEGEKIRLRFPDLTEERRKELAKLIGKKAEEARIRVRAVRREAMEEVKKAKKDGEIPEDDAKRLEEEIQKLTDKHVKMINEIAENKEKEVMTL